MLILAWQVKRIFSFIFFMLIDDVRCSACLYDHLVLQEARSSYGHHGDWLISRRRYLPHNDQPHDQEHRLPLGYENSSVSHPRPPNHCDPHGPSENEACAQKDACWSLCCTFHRDPVCYAAVGNLCIDLWDIHSHRLSSCAGLPGGACVRRNGPILGFHLQRCKVCRHSQRPLQTLINANHFNKPLRSSCSRLWCRHYWSMEHVHHRLCSIWNLRVRCLDPRQTLFYRYRFRYHVWFRIGSLHWPFRCTSYFGVSLQPRLATDWVSSYLPFLSQPSQWRPLVVQFFRTRPTAGWMSKYLEASCASRDQQSHLSLGCYTQTTSC